MADGVLIDNATGKSGGQIVRTALALSAITGRPLHMPRIRTESPTPGLTEAHVVAVRALAACTRARVGGAAAGSTKLIFVPGELAPVEELRLRVDEGAAATLVLQAAAVPLALAAGSSRLILTGGTHVPRSPTTDFLESDWLPAMEAAGLPLSVRLLRAGYLPSGGGEILALIPGNGSPRAISRPIRSNLKVIQGVAWASNIPRTVGERLAREARRQLRRSGVAVRVDVEMRESPGQGAGIHLVAVTEDGKRTGFSMIADRTRPAERTARGAVNELFAWLDTGAAVSGALADQLLLPLALASGPSDFTTSRVTEHLLTGAAVIPRFLPVRIEVRGEKGAPGKVRIEPTTPR